MCGIFGAVALGGGVLAHEGLFPEMAASLHHRGPDGSRLLRSARCALGASRLRIVDPTEQADQPFHTPDGNSWLGCNGEIYNAGALRRRYASYPYRSRTDIETILPAYRELGVEVFGELDGMFAIAIWDAATGTLVLARDRAGEKPLFYARIGDELWFASEMQALLLHPGLDRAIDETAVSQYLRLGYPLEPRTLFAGIRRVESGTALVVDAAGLRVHRYWNPRELAQQTHAAAPAAEIAELRGLLDAAVRRQLAADAAIGVFLSGGLDSSLIATIAANAAGRERITSFTARFDADSYDEGEWATRSARRAGTRHVDVDCGTPRLLHALECVAGRLAEPVSDPALLPTFLLAETAREHVRVVLSGEGADELLGGYPTYLGHKLAGYLARAPHIVRDGVRRAVQSLPVSDRKVSIEFLLKRFVRGFDLPWPERHVRWFGSGGNATTLDATHAADWLKPLLDGFRGLDARVGPLLFDYLTYLPDQLLVKMDRATMLNSIEGRAPFLDRELSAFALGVAPQLKVHGWTTKWLLKEAARTWLPRELLGRRKRGLSVPIAGWLNGSLHAMTDRLLAPARLGRHGLVDVAAVQRALGEHHAGRANHAGMLWSVITLQLWLERWQPALADESPLREPAALPPAPALIEVWPSAPAREFVAA
ncbi:MAG TPA: asparagine synthase (glutamine-hydrolyzing) [Steroidobacteraceae bacterium]|nr:asparagine synthase (glutamine-hydrolyzing) [Steroidobacteraceae bacterium]